MGMSVLALAYISKRTKSLPLMRQTYIQFLFGSIKGEIDDT